MGRGLQAVERCLGDLILVDGVDQGFADVDVVCRGLFHVDHLMGDHAGGGEGVDGRFGVVHIHGRFKIGRILDDLGLAGLESGQTGGSFGQEAEGDLISRFRLHRKTELRRFKPENAVDFAQSTYSGLYSAVYEAAEKLRAGRDIPIVATGHLYASWLEGRPENDEGRDAKEHGMRDIVGNLGTIPVSVFPEGFDYVALGHIHYTTMVARNPKVRYSGSPFVLGFDEASIPHHILCVDLQKGAEPTVQKIETPQYFKFLRVSGSVGDIVMQLNQLKNAPTEKPLKVEVVYDYAPGVSINEALESVLEGAPFEVVSKKVKRADALAADAFSDDTLESVDVLTDEEVFKRLVMSKTGAPEMDESIQNTLNDYLPLFRQVVEEVNNETGSEEA